jgi:hypothetical protein
VERNSQNGSDAPLSGSSWVLLNLANPVGDDFSNVALTIHNAKPERPQAALILTIYRSPHLYPSACQRPTGSSRKAPSHSSWVGVLDALIALTVERAGLGAFSH